MPTLSTLRFAGPTTEALFKIGLVLTCALVIAALAWWTWQDFDDARRDAEARVSAAAMIARGYAARSIATVDAVLASAAELVEREALEGPFSETQWQRLRQIAKRLPDTGQLFIANRTGKLVAASTSYPATGNVGDREWFKRLSNDSDELYIGRALKGRSVHYLFFPIARAIYGPDHTFWGAAQVGVEVSYIAELLRDLGLGPGAHLGLYRASDGAVIARYPMTEAMLGETVAGQPFFAALEKDERWTGWVESGTESRLVSAQRLRHTPVIAAVSVPKGEVDAGPCSRLPWRVLAAAITCATLFGLTGLAVRQARQEASFRAVLSSSEAQFREMADHAPMMVWVTEPDGSCSFISRSWYEFTGQTPETSLGLGWLEAVHWEDRPKLEEIVRAHRGGREVFQVEFRLRRHDGVYKWMLDAAAPRFNREGGFLGYIGCAVDISERKEAELALAERNAQLALAGEAAQVGGYILDVPSRRIKVTEGFAAIYQLPAGTTEISEDEWRAMVNPDDLSRLDDLRSQSFASKSERVFEFRIVRPDGQTRWIESRSLVTYDSAGCAQRIVGVNIDLSNHKYAEELQAQMIAELDHRVKNVLAKVAIVAARTRETSQSLDEFGNAFEGRIQSMAKAHTLLSRNRWHGVSLNEIASEELATYATGTNTTIDGPDVTLVPEASQAVASVLHELATNAAKYGALSVPEGRVGVRWSFADGAIGPARLVIRWEERGGPPVSTPIRTGFGTRIVRGAVAHQLGGRVDMTFATEGLCCTIELPASRIRQGSW